MTFRTNHPADERTRAAADVAIERVVAIASLGAIALIHVLQAPSAFADAGYLGGLFVAAVVASVALAAALTVTGDPRAMQASGALAAAVLLGYVLSRTTGLPAVTDDVGDWAEPLGLASMVFEGLLVAVAAGSTVAVAGSDERRAGGAVRPFPGVRPGHSAG